MKITILGAGTAVPAKQYSPAGIYCNIGREHVLLDAGPGTLQRLRKIGISPFHLDRVFLTHYHVDHCLDLVSLLFALRIPRPVRRKPLSVYGPSGLKRWYGQVNRAFNGWLAPKTYQLTLTEVGETTLRLHGYTVKTKRMKHSTQAIGYRLEARGKHLAYSGDTDVCEAVVRLGDGADLLILECSMPDERKVAGHLTPSECGCIAAKANCRQLVLTHFYPVFHGHNIRRRVQRFFRGRLTLAKDLTIVTL